MGYEEILRMPIRTFWSFYAQISRIQAELDTRLLDVIIGSKSQEGVKELQKHLKKAMGDPIVIDEPDNFDEGWNALKGMAGQKVGDKV